MHRVPDELAVHPDRLKWNARYSGRAAGFAGHPLAARALSMTLPAGPVLELASGPSGSALLAAEAGRNVTAVDVSDVALEQLGAEAEHRGLPELVTLVQADLTRWRPEPGRYCLVICTGYWDRTVFAGAAAAVAPGGLLAWEALTEAARRERPSLAAAWCLGPGEPAALLPAGFAVLVDDARPVAEPAIKRQMLARRAAAAA